MLDFVRWFHEIGLDERPVVGGKAASLGELERAGIQVPPGFAVTTASFERFLATIDPEGSIRAGISKLDHRDRAGLSEATSAIRARIESAPLPEEVETAAIKAYAALCGAESEVAVAVRSSATSEDSADASFAGLQETYLWVRGAQALQRSIRRCWASLYSEPSVDYRLRRGLPEQHVAMGVVVQCMVNARCAGVMFTRSPTSGDRSVITIEASWGLGSSLVSGEVTPDKYVVHKITGEIGRRTVSRKTVRHVPNFAAGGIREEVVPDDLQEAPCLTDPEIEALTRIGKAVERHYGSPQDIEWAIDRQIGAPDNICLLQSRPETVWSSRETKPIATPKANPFEHLLTTLGGGVNRQGK